MTKTELITRISDELGITKKEAEKNFNGIFSVIKDVLLEDGTIQINGFGAFSIKERSARNCYNFKTKESMLVPAFKTISFKQSRTLKDLMNK